MRRAKRWDLLPSASAGIRSHLSRIPTLPSSSSGPMSITRRNLLIGAALAASSEPPTPSRTEPRFHAHQDTSAIPSRAGARPSPSRPSRPPAPRPRPAVLMLHGADGLNTNTQYREGARDVAAAGYQVHLVHYLDRTGERRASFGTLFQNFMPWMEHRAGCARLRGRSAGGRSVPHRHRRHFAGRGAGACGGEHGSAHQGAGELFRSAAAGCDRRHVARCRRLWSCTARPTPSCRWRTPTRSRRCCASRTCRTRSRSIPARATASVARRRATRRARSLAFLQRHLRASADGARPNAGAAFRANG